MRVSKSTMRLAAPNPVKYALPWLERLELSITKRPRARNPHLASRDSIRLRKSASSSGDDEVECHPGEPHVEPPAFAHLRHEPQHDEGERHPDKRAERGELGQIGDEQCEAHAIEPEARLDHESAVKTEGQF